MGSAIMIMSPKSILSFAIGAIVGITIAAIAGYNLFEKVAPPMYEEDIDSTLSANQLFAIRKL